MRKGFISIVSLVIAVAVLGVGAWLAISVSGGVGNSAGKWIEDSIQGIPGLGPEDTGGKGGEDGGEGSGSETSGRDFKTSGVYISKVCNEREDVMVGGDKISITPTVVNKKDSSQGFWVELVVEGSGNPSREFEHATLESGGEWTETWSIGGIRYSMNAGAFEDGYRIQVWASKGEEPQKYRFDAPIDQRGELLTEFNLKKGDVPKSGYAKKCVGPGVEEGEEYAVKLWSSPGMSGDAKTIDGSIDSLGLFEGKTSSVELGGESMQAVLYAKENQDDSNGKMVVGGDSESVHFGNSVSSVDLPDGCSITLYEHTDLNRGRFSDIGPVSTGRVSCTSDGTCETKGGKEGPASNFKDISFSAAESWENKAGSAEVEGGGSGKDCTATLYNKPENNRGSADKLVLGEGTTTRLGFKGRTSSVKVVSGERTSGFSAEFTSSPDFPIVKGEPFFATFELKNNEDERRSTDTELAVSHPEKDSSIKQLLTTTSLGAGESESIRIDIPADSTKKLSPGEGYNFRVRALDKDGNSLGTIISTTTAVAESSSSGCEFTGGSASEKLSAEFTTPPPCEFVVAEPYPISVEITNSGSSERTFKLWFRLAHSSLSSSAPTVKEVTVPADSTKTVEMEVSTFDATPPKEDYTATLEAIEDGETIGIFTSTTVDVVEE